jgi:3D (Asp-Asp-Asp) domain-containing protein
MPREGRFCWKVTYMSTHIRTWGIAIIAIGFFAIPTLVTQAQMTPPATKVLAPSADAIVKTLYLKVTAYASVPEETSDHPFITADGSHVHDGVVATNLLPFGTKVMIPSLFGTKVFTVNDRMNKKKTNNIDIWMPTVNDAVDFGVHNAQIVVLGKTASDTSLSLK